MILFQAMLLLPGKNLRECLTFFHCSRGVDAVSPPQSSNKKFAYVSSAALTAWKYVEH